jgi:hypothetical protein
MARGDDRECGRNDVVPAPVIVLENTWGKGISDHAKGTRGCPHRMNHFVHVKSNGISISDLNEL